MVLKGLERRLERMVDGVFARAFRSGLRPIEIGRRLVREMDDHRTVDPRGRTVVPNHFTVRVSQADHDQFAEISDALVRELAEAARDYARDEGYAFMGPVQVELQADARQRTGTCEVQGRLREGAAGAGAGSLVLSTGERFPLGDKIFAVGRMPECSLVLSDPNVSRRHAEVRRADDGFIVVDLGSTNGTRVNGVAIREHRLDDGDEVAFGNTRLRFEAS